LNTINSAFLVHHKHLHPARSALLNLSAQTSVTLADLFGIMRELF